MNHSLSRLLLLSCLFVFGSAVHVSMRNGLLGKYCFVMDSGITGSVQYYSTENKTVTYNFKINSTTTITGKCLGYEKGLNSTVESVYIHFLPNDITPEPPMQDEEWTLHLKFEAPQDTKSGSFKIVDYSLKAVFPPSFNASLPGNETTFHYTKPKGADLEWGAVDTHGFTCSNAELTLTNSSSVSFTNLKVLAFAVLEKDQFPNTQLFEQCKLDVRTSDLVPIIVGACLAGLVIIVLVAYLIGRARAKRQGYASV